MSGRDRQKTTLYAPTTGVREDFKLLMDKFIASKTVRFEKFSELWCAQRMSLLCAARNTDREAKEFIERVFAIAYEYFVPPYQFQVRVGGLYLLYAIFRIQPLIPKVKIRMTPQAWQDTLQFQQQAAQQNHLDVVFIFNRLLLEQAFQFCFTKKELCLQLEEDNADSSGTGLAEELKEEKSVINNLFNYETMEQLSYLQGQYQLMKVGLSGPSATKPDKSLDVVHEDLVEDVIVLLEKFKDKVATISKHGKKAIDFDKGEISETSQQNETTGSRRKALKAQAFSQATPSTSRSTFNIIVEKTDDLSKEKKTKTPLAITVDDDSSSGDDKNDEDYDPSSEFKFTKTRGRPANVDTRGKKRSRPPKESESPNTSPKKFPPNRRTSKTDVKEEKRSRSPEQNNFSETSPKKFLSNSQSRIVDVKGKKRGRPTKQSKCSDASSEKLLPKSRPANVDVKGKKRGRAPKQSESSDSSPDKFVSNRTNKITFKRTEEISPVNAENMRATVESKHFTSSSNRKRTISKVSKKDKHVAEANSRGKQPKSESGKKVFRGKVADGEEKQTSLAEKHPADVSVASTQANWTSSDSSDCSRAKEKGNLCQAFLNMSAKKLGQQKRKLFSVETSDESSSTEQRVSINSHENCSSKREKKASPSKPYLSPKSPEISSNNEKQKSTLSFPSQQTSSLASKEAQMSQSFTKAVLGNNGEASNNNLPSDADAINKLRQKLARPFSKSEGNRKLLMNRPKKAGNGNEKQGKTVVYETRFI